MRFSCNKYIFHGARKWILPSLLILLLLACKTHRHAVSSTASENGLAAWTMKYDLGPCFGECPVYTFYLLHDHRGLLDVKAHFLERGWYEANLDQEKIELLLMALEPESVWNEDHSTLPQIEELPTMAMVYKHADGLRWYSTQSKITHHFSETFRGLGHLISDAIWKPSVLRPLQPDLAEPYDVIVQLKPGVDIEAWMRKFDSFGIQLKRKVAPRQSYYVVSKDPAKGLSAVFLQRIKADPDVIGAQWDQPLSRRQD